LIIISLKTITGLFPFVHKIQGLELIKGFLKHSAHVNVEKVLKTIDTIIRKCKKHVIITKDLLYLFVFGDGK
jgi:hypothetical protein